MLNSIVKVFFDIVFSIFGAIVEVVTKPIWLLLSALIPDLHDFQSIFNSYVTDYLLPGVAYAREVFFNVTHFPRSLYTILVSLFLARITFHFTSSVIKFIVNTYKTFKGAGGEMIE